VPEAFERTEAPTPRRRQRAQERGMVARSPMATAAASVAGGLGMGAVAAGSLAAWLARPVAALPGRLPAQADLAWGERLIREALVGAAFPVLVVGAGACAAAVAAGIAQTGFVLAPSVLAPRAERLDPVAGLARMLSRTAAAEMARGALTVAVAAWVVVGALRDLAGALAGGGAGTVPGALGVARAVMVPLLGRLLGIGAALGAADYGWKRWQLEKALRMTRQELREELRETEGDPFWRARRRARARALARARMLQQVPRATVVVTNPEEVAVALRYARPMPAPQVVAKGLGHMAARIRETAARAGVPVYPNPPLARALYGAADVGQYIPPRLYRAVAEVLAWVYRTLGTAPEREEVSV
jgi:flagellar biosynthetic protein FlhB